MQGVLMHFRMNAARALGAFLGFGMVSLIVGVGIPGYVVGASAVFAHRVVSAKGESGPRSLICALLDLVIFSVLLWAAAT